jgi:hypothetical protein
LAGGLKRVLETLDLKSVIPAERVFEALREAHTSLHRR